MSQRLKDFISILILAAVYVAAGKVGLSLATVNASASAIWPPTGVALAALLLGGHRLWPGVFLGAFLANAAVPGHILVDLGIATGNTLEAVLGAWFVRQLAHGAKFSEQANTVLKFAF